MTDEVFSLLREAVTVSRNEQIRGLETLRTRLLQAHPGKEVVIDDALHAWAIEERRSA
jgi:hypothetical protein